MKATVSWFLLFYFHIIVSEKCNHMLGESIPAYTSEGTVTCPNGPVNRNRLMKPF